MSFKIRYKDITKIKADAIVFSANPKPVCGDGMDAAIYEAAGYDNLLEARRAIGRINRGDAAVTSAFNLDAKILIHTVGPVWDGGDKGEFDILRSCYDKSLNLAKISGCKSIAFPLISTGVYGFPKEKALEIASQAFEDYQAENDMDIYLVVLDRKNFVPSGNFIFVKEYLEESRNMINRRNFVSGDYKEEAVISPLPSKKKLLDVTGYTKGKQKTFQERFFELVDERKLTGPEVYKNYVSKQVYSKILSDKDCKPNKKTIILLSMSLKLSLEELLDLLERAGYALSMSNEFDMVIRACFINGEYSINELNKYLFALNLGDIDSVKQFHFCLP